MSEQRLELYRTLARALVWVAAVVFVLSIVVAISIATSDSELGFGAIEREGRGIAALAALGAGIVAGAGLAGLGAVLDLLIELRATGRRDGTAGPDRQ